MAYSTVLAYFKNWLIIHTTEYIFPVGLKNWNTFWLFSQGFQKDGKMVFNIIFKLVQVNALLSLEPKSTMHYVINLFYVNFTIILHCWKNGTYAQCIQ